MRLHGLFIAVAAVCAQADVVQLNTGRQVKGEVVGYSNVSFEVIPDGQSAVKYAAPAIRRIEFDARPAPAMFETRSQGVVQGNVTIYENSTFTIQSTNGPARKLAAVLVNRASFQTQSASGTAEVITHGANVDITKHLVRGKVTVIDYYADWCGPCKFIAPFLQTLAKDDPDVVVRKVDIVSWNSEIARQRHIGSIPRIEVYDRAGKLIGTVEGVRQPAIQDYVNQAKKAPYSPPK